METKRGAFPRFYFLSNEDLLEIIGQAREPGPINKHIKKLFEGIYELGYDENGKGNNKTYTITSLKSSDEEIIDLPSTPKPVPVDQRVEGWLNKLIKAMQEALRRGFYKFGNESGQLLKKMGEADKMWSAIARSIGQILITSSQMQWTQDVENALKNMDNSTQGANSIKKIRTMYRKKIDTYVEIITKRPKMHRKERKKIETLVIIDEHNREVIEKINALKVSTVNHFEWQQQLRFKKANGEEQNEQLFI